MLTFRSLDVVNKGDSTKSAIYVNPHSETNKYVSDKSTYFFECHFNITVTQIVKSLPPPYFDD